MEQRRQYALKSIDLTSEGLELGPLMAPLVLKSDGNIFYVDHMSAADLIKKYHYGAADAKEVVEVDYVLGTKTLAEVLKGKQFDYVLASHVIEHLPDMIGWLQDISKVLKPGGLLSLVIPDKRFTFDITRNVSRPADIIGAYLDHYTRTSSATMYDYISEVRRDVVAHDIWNADPSHITNHPRIYTTKEAYATTVQNLDPHDYVDCHCNIFTPESFVELLRVMIAHDLFDYEIVTLDSTPENQLEFYVTMRKADVSAKQRFASLPDLPAPRQTWELEAEVKRLQAELARVTGSRSQKLNLALAQAKRPLRKIRKVVRQVRKPLGKLKRKLRG